MNWLRLWLKRRRMWANRTCWTWPRKPARLPEPALDDRSSIQNFRRIVSP